MDDRIMTTLKTCTGDNVNNPYGAPAADLSRSAEVAGQYEPEAWSTRGRIGRVRYIAYSYWMSTAIVFVLSLVFGFIVAGNSRLFGLQALAYLPMVAVIIVMSVRRLHDLGLPGWWAGLMLVPLLNVLMGLWLVAAPGDRESNRYGPPPSPNSTLVVIGGAVLPVILMAAMVAAVAIPAYFMYMGPGRALTNVRP